MTTKKDDSTQTYTLLIFELHPEDIKLYRIPNSEIDDEARAVLELAHGEYVGLRNTSEEIEEAICKLNVALSENEESWDPGIDKRWHGCWSAYFIPNKMRIKNTMITSVYLTGYVL